MKRQKGKTETNLDGDEANRRGNAKKTNERTNRLKWRKEKRRCRDKIIKSNETAGQSGVDGDSDRSGYDTKTKRKKKTRNEHEKKVFDVPQVAPEIGL